MIHKWKLLVMTVVTLLSLAILGVGVSQAGPPGPIELPDVLEARPDLPVRSIPVVSPLPSHPRGGPPGENGCNEDVDLTSTIKGVVSVAALNTNICTNADIDTYVRDLRTYVVLAGGDDAAWTHIDVTDPTNPVIVGQFKWRGNGKNTYTPDVKTFQQGGNDYIVLALERRKLSAPGGVVIYQVNNPGNPVKQSQTTGSDWVDVHNIFVEDDPITGFGAFIYVTADNSSDLRVLDINSSGSVSSPAEIGRYFRNTRGFFGSGFYDDIYVHDVTVANGVVYASYWLAGLDIFPALLIKPGTIDETNTNVVNIDPPDFTSGNPLLVHHAFPSSDGSLVAFQDEIEISSDAEVVQLWSTSPLSRVDGLAQGSDIPVLPAHNLEIRYDLDFDQDGTLDPNRLFVGWYKAGLEAWDFSSGGFARKEVSHGRTSVQYHQVQTEPDDADYSGAWGVRMQNITVGGSTDLYLFQSDRNFGLIVDCVGCTATATGSITGRVTDSSSGDPIEGASVSANTGQSTTSTPDGSYTLTDVPTGDRTVTASASGYVSLSQTTTVTDGGTSMVHFPLDPETTGGGTGTIKGTVTDDNTGAKLVGVTITTDTGESAITNRGGKYSIKDVPEGERTVTASKNGYVTQPKAATVVAGGTTTVDFALVPVSE